MADVIMFSTVSDASSASCGLALQASSNNRNVKACIVIYVKSGSGCALPMFSSMWAGHLLVQQINIIHNNISPSEGVFLFLQ